MFRVDLDHRNAAVAGDGVLDPVDPAVAVRVVADRVDPPVSGPGRFVSKITTRWGIRVVGVIVQVTNLPTSNLFSIRKKYPLSTM